MTDDEVEQWLSVEEKRVGTVSGDTRWVLRSLAETRKALWGAKGVVDACLADGMECPSCDVTVNELGAGDNHKPTCIFTTMPRPK
jgi:hypothetical protein